MSGRNRREGSNDRTRHPEDRNKVNEDEQSITDDPVTEDDRVLDEAADALTDMRAHEMRQGGFRSRGDDQSPGIETDVNAPKKSDMRD